MDDKERKVMAVKGPLCRGHDELSWDLKQEEQRAYLVEVTTSAKALRWTEMSSLSREEAGMAGRGKKLEGIEP